MTTHVDSTSDDRTANNAMRHRYRTLSEAEKAQMQEIKDLGAAFTAKLHEIGDTDATSDRFASRNLALANTHAEDAVMRAVRHITA
ncbi:Acb2/Tad1 domain-containing protein [Salipiger abyssi]|uniref:Acb2/Tad1 domain-containing protein n=1 Tax=Salipiger abyssi TaxID=1250539 RepID=UPI0040592CC4